MSDPERVFEFRPQPRRTTAFVVPVTIAFIAIGVSLMAGAFHVRGPEGDTETVAVILFVMGLGFIGVAALPLWLAVRGARTTVRLVVHEDDLVVEWRRDNAVTRTERIPRADLVDVAIDRQPASSETGELRYVHRLVLGTRHADLAFDESFWGSEALYRAQRERVCRFLNLPAAQRE